MGQTTFYVFPPTERIPIFLVYDVPRYTLQNTASELSILQNNESPTNCRASEMEHQSIILINALLVKL